MRSTSDEVGHTATPWTWVSGHATCDGRATWSLVGSGGYGILSCDGELNSPQCLGDEGAANAAFILRAVNSHDSLVKALETAKSFLNDQLLWNAIIDIDNQEETLGDVIDAALSQAKGVK